MLTRKFNLYRADLLNNRVAFFFDTLKKNLMFGATDGSSVFRSSSLVNAMSSRFLPELPADIALLQSLGFFENHIFRFIFYLNDCFV